MIAQALSLSSRSVHNVFAAAEILERGDDLGSVTNLAFDLGFNDSGGERDRPRSARLYTNLFVCTALASPKAVPGSETKEDACICIQFLLDTNISAMVDPHSRRVCRT